jgi:hypothetical protein
VLKPDGTLVLRLPREATVEPTALRDVLASCFDAVDVFSWDGLCRMSPSIATVDRFAICRPFLPYATRSLELLRPRVVADNDWQSSWLCIRPELPDRFLLRATLDLIGEVREADLRLRFLAHEGARFRFEGHVNGCS